MKSPDVAKSFIQESIKSAEIELMRDIDWWFDGYLRTCKTGTLNFTIVVPDFMLGNYTFVKDYFRKGGWDITFEESFKNSNEWKAKIKPLQEEESETEKG